MGITTPSTSGRPFGDEEDSPTRMASTGSQEVGMLRAALIGTGSIAREHLDALSRMPGVELCAFLRPLGRQGRSDRRALRCQEVVHGSPSDARHCPCRPRAHHDAAYIALFHIARDCLASGFNVLCEKPITVELSEFRELRELAAGNGLVLTENHNLRFDSSTQRILDLVRSGELGELADVQVQVFLDVKRYADPNAPRPCLSMRGGAIADFLTHIGYLVCLFAGSPRELRTAWSKCAERIPAACG